MTAITLKFKGLEEKLVNEMVRSGLFSSKSEAIRSALVKYAIDLGLFKRKALWEEIESMPKRKVSPARLKKDLERIEDEA